MTDFRRGTNIHHRVAMANRDPERLLAVAASRQARCVRGDHDVTEVPANRVVYTRGGTGHPVLRRSTGERYCLRCGETIAREVTVRCPRCQALTTGVVEIVGGRMTCSRCERLMTVPHAAHPDSNAQEDQ